MYRMKNKKYLSFQGQRSEWHNCFPQWQPLMRGSRLKRN